MHTEGAHKHAFDEFVQALRAGINEAITEEQAVEMLAQHLITRPVFDALFQNYQFATNNTVCQSIEKMIDVLVHAGLEKDTAVLNKFYDSVRMNVGDIDNLAGKQTVIKNLYEKFFKGAFPKTVDQLGIVYTPIEWVDFILHSVNGVLQKEFNCTLSDENVHILDPFTGTGTFITRLLQSGLIKPEDMERKYRHEIHCNEIVLLAYYVADVNIESVFHDVTRRKEYLKFDNICLTDTFECTTEKCGNFLYTPFKDNSEAITRQNKLPIKVIVGNPPYSAGQKSANDNAQNLKYTLLDKRIEETYVSRVKVTNKNSLYDSYIRAFRWASDRLQQGEEGGVIGFVTNGGWLDGNAAAGFRQCLEEEFSSVYVFHLRGNQRTSGELSRREGGKIFGAGSRAPVVITLLVYNPNHEGKAHIHYCDIGDYLKREDKLKTITKYRAVTGRSMPWTVLEPNEHGDWLNKRSELFGSFIALGDKKGKGKQVFFEPYYSRGVATGRDVWCYNSSTSVLQKNIIDSIDFYNSQCGNVLEKKDILYDVTKFSWSDSTITGVLKEKKISFSFKCINEAIYRPYYKQYIYFSRGLNERVYQMPQLFPTQKHENIVICVNGTGGKSDFSSFITSNIPDVQLMQNGQCFPLYYYKQKDLQQMSLLTGDNEAYERKDGITDWILKNVRSRFSNTRAITKEHIFYYVYGILHSKDYRNRFNADLKKSLPRIPIVDDIETFMTFSQKGKELALLHLDYENVDIYPDLKVTGTEHANFTVDKMRFAKNGKEVDKTTILYNNYIKIENIPLKAYEYVVNGRSAIEWIMERYQIKTDKDSGIVNNPNHWAEEQGNLRYILDLVGRVVNVSMQTVGVVEGLPRLGFE